MKTCLFDIETGPLPLEQIEHLCPEFKAPANYKDAAKIAENIAEQKVTWIERGALSALTGRVIAIGLRTDGITTILQDDDEAVNLRAFWLWLEDRVRERRAVVGFNSNKFDIPFLTRRSWAHGIAIPSGVYMTRGYVNQSVFIDLALEWQCGDRMEWVKLDTVCKFLGLPAKNGSGKEFAGLWVSDRAKALEYLNNDMAITAKVMERMLSISEAPTPAPVAADLDY